MCSNGNPSTSRRFDREPGRQNRAKGAVLFAGAPQFAYGRIPVRTFHYGRGGNPRDASRIPDSDHERRAERSIEPKQCPHR